MNADNKKDEIDLSGMLKKYDVKFQNDKQKDDQIFRDDIPPMVQWVMKYSGGLIKSDKQAIYLILFLILVIFLFSLFLSLDSLRLPPPPPADQIIEVARPK